MDVDEHVPPMLVSVDGRPGPDAVEAGLTSEMANVTLAKVPISIITGRTLSSRFAIL